MRSVVLGLVMWSAAALAEEAVSTRVALERPAFDFAIGAHSFTRAFGPADGTRFMATYSGGSSGVGLSAHWYPLAPVTAGAGGNWGFFGEGAFSIGLITTFNAQQYASSAALLRGGLAWRIPLGRAGLLVHAGVSSQGFTMGQVSVGAVPRPPIPDVGFLGPRAGLSVEVALARTVNLEAAAAFTYALTSGEVASFVSGASTLGLDAKLGLSWEVATHLQLRLSGDLSRYFITGTRHAAADQYLGGTLGLAFSI